MYDSDIKGNLSFSHYKYVEVFVHGIDGFSGNFGVWERRERPTAALSICQLSIYFFPVVCTLCALYFAMLRSLHLY